MLMRDYSYHIYRSLYSCLEVTDTSVEQPTSAPEPTDEQAASSESKEEQVEPMLTSVDDDALPGLDLHADDTEKKRKRTPSQVRVTDKRVQGSMTFSLYAFRTTLPVSGRSRRKTKASRRVPKTITDRPAPLPKPGSEPSNPNCSSHLHSSTATDAVTWLRKISKRSSSSRAYP